MDAEFLLDAVPYTCTGCLLKVWNIQLHRDGIEVLSPDCCPCSADGTAATPPQSDAAPRCMERHSSCPNVHMGPSALDLVHSPSAPLCPGVTPLNVLFPEPGGGMAAPEILL